MNAQPRLLLWGYSPEEKQQLDDLLARIGAPGAVTIEAGQGNLTLKEIIHTDQRSEHGFECDERVVLFYNIPEKGVVFLIQAHDSLDLPRPIFAMVTEHSIKWPFNVLMEHLIEERDAERGHDSP